MNQGLLLAVITSVAHSQCSFSSEPFPSNIYGVQSGSGNSCGNFTTISRPLSKISSEQPVYMFLLPNIARLSRVDSACITFFPLPDRQETYKAYISYVYVDGSTTIESFITKSVEKGANFWSSPTRGFTHNNLGDIGCGVYLRRTCPNYGNAANPSFISFGPGTGNVGNGTGKLTEECLENARNLAKKNGLDLGDVYLPPYNLPTNCVFKQICLEKNNPLSCQQGNTCKDYNTSTLNSP